MTVESSPVPEHAGEAIAPHDVVDARSTTCCVVGGGPAGALLSLLLARRGIPVTLLEAHADFDRDFRGDTIHPAIMEILDEIGLADRVLELPHAKVRRLNPPGGDVQIDLGGLKTRFPFITMLPQARFLELLTAEAARYPAFRLVMSASVRELVVEDGLVRGVRYQGTDGWHEVRALLTVGADGRFSRLRRLAELPPPVRTSQPIDVLWFRLPRAPSDPEGLQAQLGGGAGLIMLDRGELWQFGYLMPKDGYKALRAAGLPALRRSLAERAPWLADRLELLADWHQFSLLSVESDRLPRWYRPGLLLIGDAAHVMSPAGGNGINYAVQDAAAAFNRLAGPLAAGRVTTRDLAAVQRRREPAVRLTQAIVNQMQNRILLPALRSSGPVGLPRAARILLGVPLVRALPLRWIAFGPWPVHIEPSLRPAVEVR